MKIQTVSFIAESEGFLFLSQGMPGNVGDAGELGQRVIFIFIFFQIRSELEYKEIIMTMRVN